MGKPKKYLVEHSDYDGYRQHFSMVYGWKNVLLSARDYSILPGDKVYAVIDCKQPKLPKARE